MHCEPPWHQVRYTFGERESMEILSGEIMGQLKSFTGSRHLIFEFFIKERDSQRKEYERRR